MGDPDRVSGDNYIYYSPLRERENTPSFFVNNKRGIHDFGTEKHYSVISFVKDLYQISYEEAIQRIIVDFEIRKEELEKVEPIIKTSSKKKYTKKIELEKGNTPQNIICYFDEEMFETKPKDSYEFAGIKNRIRSNDFTEYNSILEIADEIIRGKTCIPSAIKNRAQENWRQQQIFLVDFDNKINNESISYNDFRHISEEKILDYCKKINLLPTIVYNTFSHSEYQHKFRLVYVFEEPITDIDIANSIIQYLLKQFKNYNPDISKKNLSDMFLGGKNIAYMGDNYYKVKTK